MRHPRLRLRLRTLLIAVAVVGVAIGGWQMWKRREVCLKQAAIFEVKLDVAERAYRQTLVYRQTLGATQSLRTTLTLRRLQLYINRCREALDRYRRGARHPWLPLPREPE